MINQSLLNLIPLQAKSVNFFDLKGAILRVAVVENPPFNELVYDSEGNITKINGYLGRMWKILEDQLLFRTVWVTPVNSFLGKNHNGTWDGIMGQLQKKEADVALNNFAITRERKMTVDFSASVFFDSSRLLSNADAGAEDISWMIFMSALSWQIWVCFGVLWLSISLCLAFVARKEENSSKYNYLFALFGAIALQGCEVEPKSFQGRLIFISFWAMCVVMYASFTARLTTQLTAPNVRIVTNLEQALDKGYQISVIIGTNQHQAFVESKSNDAYHKIGNMLLEHPELVAPSLEKAIEAVALNKKVMLLYDYSSIQYLTSRNCTFRIEQASYFEGYLHLAYRKNLPYSDILNQMIIRLNTNGALSKLNTDWQKSLGTGACVTNSDEIPSLGLGKLLFAFVVLIGGALASVLSFLGELSLKKPAKKSKRKLSNKFPLTDEFMRQNVMWNNYLKTF